MPALGIRPYNGAMTDHLNVAGPDLSAGDRWLAALAQRDFDAMARCLAPDIRFRALVPPGPFEAKGRTAVIAHLRRWFGGDDDFELLDGSVGAIGTRLHLRWRVRMTSTGSVHASRTAEQHAFATVADSIETLDLLCSGFFSAQSARHHVSVPALSSAPGDRA